METHNILSFLADLKSNNALEWMRQNKKAYIHARTEFINLVEALAMRITEMDDSIPILNPESLIFKLNRDTRFSKNKLPYNPAFRAHISSNGKIPIPVGYYISIAPNNQSFLGGGLFAATFKDATTMIRDHITEHGADFEKIIALPGFQNHFSVEGERLKNVPVGYDANHPQASYLKNKSWYLQSPVLDSLILDPERFIDEAVELFSYMKPFNHFLNNALKDFSMLERK